MSKFIDNFEGRSFKTPGGGQLWRNEDVSSLLAHARALEQILSNVRNDSMLTLRVQQVWVIDELLGKP